MRRVLTLLAGSLLLACVPLTCHFAPAVLAPLSGEAGVRESREGVIRRAREGLERLRVRYGPGGPDARWTETDREIWENCRAALRREGQEE